MDNKKIDAMLASAPASPAIGIQAVKALEALINDVQEWVDAVGRGTSWDYWDHHYKHLAYGGLDKYRAALEAALHPAPEAASAGAAGETDRPVVNGHVLYVNSDTDKPEGACDGNGDLALGVCRVCGNFEAGLDDAPCPGPSPKGVSDGVREAVAGVMDHARAINSSFRDHDVHELIETRDELIRVLCRHWRDLYAGVASLEAALSQEPVSPTAEERAASKEGA